MNRLFIALIFTLLAGCAFSNTSTLTPSESVSTSPTMPAITPLTPTLTSITPLYEGWLLFSRFIEASHTFTGMFVAQTDGSGEETVPLPWSEGGGRWSKSGTQIAVPTLLADGRIGTAIIGTDGALLRVFSIPDATLNLPCTIWSTDDSRLACEAWDDTDPSRNGIYTVRASDGAGLQRLTTPPSGFHDLPGDYSSAGQFVFKRHTGDEDPGPLMLVDVSGGEPLVLYDRPVEDSGRFSPDGQFVVTSSNGSLMVIGMDGKVVQTISISNSYAFGPVWSPDGTRIAFSLAAETGPFAGSFADIYTCLPDGTDCHRVTNTSENEILVDWGVIND